MVYNVTGAGPVGPTTSFSGGNCSFGKTADYPNDSYEGGSTGKKLLFWGATIAALIGFRGKISGGVSKLLKMVKANGLATKLDNVAFLKSSKFNFGFGKAAAKNADDATKAALSSAKADSMAAKATREQYETQLTALKKQIKEASTPADAAKLQEQLTTLEKTAPKIVEQEARTATTRANAILQQQNDKIKKAKDALEDATKAQKEMNALTSIPEGKITSETTVKAILEDKELCKKLSADQLKYLATCEQDGTVKKALEFFEGSTKKANQQVQLYTKQQQRLLILNKKAQAAVNRFSDSSNPYANLSTDYGKTNGVLKYLFGQK